MKSNRIRVGFHRVGVALAILPLLAALAVVIAGTYQWGRPLVKPPVFQVEHKATGKSFDYTYGTDPYLIGQRMKTALGLTPVPDELINDVAETLARVDIERERGLELLAIAGALIAAAVGVYAGSWLLGWIVRGFMAEDAT